MSTLMSQVMGLVKFAGGFRHQQSSLRKPLTWPPSAAAAAAADTQSSAARLEEPHQPHRVRDCRWNRIQRLEKKKLIKPDRTFKTCKVANSALNV